MKAVVFAGVAQVEVATVSDAEIREATDAIIAVERTAICGSDLHPYRGEWGDPAGQRPGHEFIGTIVEVGRDVASRRVGERLYATWMLMVLPLGWTVSHVLLGLVYFGVITPIGLGLRLLGRDLLGRRADPEASTYWQQRPPSADSRRYMRQF